MSIWCTCLFSALFRDVIFMMQMSHAGVQMQSLSMMVPAHIFNRNPNVSLQRWRCKISCGANAFYWACHDANTSCRDVMMQMSLWCMPWCECPLVGMSWCKCFDANTIYSKIPFIFKTRLPQCLKPKFFQKLDLLFMKSHLLIHFFDLKLSKNWWSLLENLQMRHWLGIWWSGSTYLFSQFGWTKRWLVSKAFFWKKIFFENQAS